MAPTVDCQRRYCTLEDQFEVGRGQSWSSEPGTIPLLDLKEIYCKNGNVGLRHQPKRSAVSHCSAVSHLKGSWKASIDVLSMRAVGAYQYRLKPLYCTQIYGVR